jgi:hypothetical protein
VSHSPGTQLVHWVLLGPSHVSHDASQTSVHVFGAAPDSQ